LTLKILWVFKKSCRTHGFFVVRKYALQFVTDIVYNIVMAKTQLQSKAEFVENPTLSKKESLDILLGHVAQGKKEITQGQWYSPTQVREHIRKTHENRILTKG
jgi:hypothetical protein